MSTKTSSPANLPTVRPPNQSSTLDEFAEYAKGRFAEATSLSRRTTVVIYQAGHAVALAHDQLTKRGDWKRWLADHNIARTTAYEAEQIYRGCGSAKKAASMTITEARTKYVTNHKKASGKKGGARSQGDEPKDQGSKNDHQDGDRRGNQCDESDAELGRFEKIGHDGALVHAPALLQITKAAGNMRLLVLRSWDGRARVALARGIAVLVIPQIEEGCRP